MIELKLFNDFWINCWFNSNYSIITSINESYIGAAYMNNYSYISEEAKSPFETTFKYMKIGPSEAQNKFILSIIKQVPIKFKEKYSISELVIKLLKENPFFLGVDLYYLVPDSICFKKHHFNHFTLIKEYNVENDAFIVFDESFQGYEAHSIPRARFEEAAMASSLEIDAYLLQFNENIVDYDFNYLEVSENASRLSIELEILLGDYWQLSDKDLKAGFMLDFFAMYAFGITNRQTANIELMKLLYSKGLISENKYVKLVSKFKSLEKEWEILKGRFIKSSISRRFDVQKMNEYKNLLIVNEIEAWKMLLN
ncbi:MAG: hypothetical protein FWE14_03515 [Lachnospiraceae bacterium]|nr:hypothetical protein [Lachnospiraceae bacterium]